MQQSPIIVRRLSSAVIRSIPTTGVYTESFTTKFCEVLITRLQRAIDVGHQELSFSRGNEKEIEQGEETNDTEQPEQGQA